MNFKNLKKIFFFTMFLLMFVLNACKEEITPRNETPNIPDTFEGRDVDVQGTAQVGSRKVTFYLWDSGLVDNDIVSFYVNGRKLLDNYSLTANKKSVEVNLDYTGYNYIMIYAHNVGSIDPNTCAVSVDDGISEQILTISADLSTNGAYNIFVK